MASQFLEIDDQDSLSWDAPLRLAWDDLFDSSSSFGASRQFYNASRYLLVNGFSEELTRSNSPYHLLVQNIANDWNTIAGHEELYGMIDRLVVKSLLSVVLGEQEEIEDITNMLDHLSADITASSSSSVHKSTKQTATLLRSVLVRIVNGRLSDVEQGIGHNDYLQFIVENKNMFNEDPDGLLNSRNASRHSDVTNTASIPSSDSPRHIADHLLVTLLQTRLLVTTCVTWKIVANTNHNAESDPAPLLLVRKTREETLFGSKIVPKDCLVGIAPVIQAASGPRTPKSRVNGWNDYRQNSTSDLDEISTTCSTADSPRSGHLGSVLRNFGSMDGKSPLLASTRYSSTVSMANLFQDTKMQLTQAGRTWDRRFPQNNLIQLLVNVIFQSMAGKFTIRSGALIKQHYGSARALWLPYPSEPILCDRAADVASASKHAQTIVSSL